MSMSRKDFEALAGVIAEAKDWPDLGEDGERMRVHLGEQIMNVCRAQHSGSGYSFDTGKFRRVARLDG